MVTEKQVYGPIDIKIFDHEIYPLVPKPSHVGEWIDLKAALSMYIKKGEYAEIPLGVAMRLPRNTEAIIVPRSSTFKNYGIILAGSIGVIDNAYCGNDDEWMFPAIALKNTLIAKGSRICQFRLFPIQGKVEFFEVNKLDETGRGGIGSTGR
jgi:dUTP pyrophosphatase